MPIHPVNLAAVLVGGIVIFILGGLWYSPVLFAKRWMALIGKSEEELKAATGSPAPLFVLAFLCGLATSLGLAIVMNHFLPATPLRGGLVGLLMWLAFAGPSSLATALFSGKPKPLWGIDTGYNLVSFVAVGVLHAMWR